MPGFAADGIRFLVHKTPDRSITVFAREFAISYGAYFLEEATYHSFDCKYDKPLAFISYKCKESRLSHQTNLRKELTALSPV